MAGSDAGGSSVRQLGRVQISTTDQIDAAKEASQLLISNNVVVGCSSCFN